MFEYLTFEMKNTEEWSKQTWAAD